MVHRLNYVYGLGLIGQEQDGEYLTYHFDLRGSTVALTNENAQVTEQFQYSLYGLLISGDTSKTPFLFNGMYGVMTDESSLYYMRARLYSPEIRRFVNQDILLGNITEGQSLNRYAYVTRQPVSYVDPYGLTKCIWFDKYGKMKSSGGSIVVCLFEENFGWIVDSEIFQTENAENISNFMMALDWLLGIGPKHQNFGPDTNQARDMMDSPSVRKAREYYKRKYANFLSCSCSQTNFNGSNVTNYIGKFKVWEFLEATKNLDSTEHFIGSYRIDIYGKADGKVSFLINNNSSFTSFWEGIPPSWSRNTFGPMGNMTQTIYWTEVMKNCP
jgi:RHS repeat-associated protein